MIIIKKISTAETYPLRIEILRNGIAKDYKFVGDGAKFTLHFGAISEDVCVGIATCMMQGHNKVNAKNPYQLRGMAVQKNLQNQGIGKNIIDFVIQELSQKDCDMLWCNAREVAVDFYQKLGFSIISEKFMIPKVGPHYVMIKKIV